MRKILEKKKLIEIFLMCLVFGVFLWRCMLILDPDFGWHWQMGRLILSSGIPKTDPFSYTMKSFPFVDHEWLTNVIIFQLYSKLGYPFLAIIYACLVILSLVFASKSTTAEKMQKSQIGHLQYLPFLLAAGAIFPFIGVRPQIESWLLLAILLRIILKEKNWLRGRYFMPVFFIFWANLHGSFAVGIFTLFLTIFLKSIRCRKIETQNLLVLVLSLLGTFLNPYGVRLWGEIWQQLSDSSLRWKIMEWVPSLFSLNLPFLALVSLSSILIFRYKSKFALEEIGLFLFFLFQATSSVRHIPLFAIFVLPISVVLIDLFYQEVKDYKYGTFRFKKFFNFFSAGAFCLFLLESQIFLNEARLLEEKNFYPLAAVEYLKENLPPGQIFSEYGWGGYLIWKLPSKKVFIDGRMPSWRWSKNISGESNYAMRDYDHLLEGKLAHNQVFDKYEIKTVLWPQPRKKNAYQKLAESLEWRILKKRPSPLFEKLKEDGWKVVYQDPITVIYQKTK